MVTIYTAYCKVINFVVALTPFYKLTQALCGLGRQFEDQKLEEENYKLSTYQPIRMKECECFLTHCREAMTAY